MSHRAAARNAAPGSDVGRYHRHRPEQTLLYQIIKQHLPAVPCPDGRESPGTGGGIQLRLCSDQGKEWGGLLFRGGGFLAKGCLYFIYSCGYFDWVDMIAPVRAWQ